MIKESTGDKSDLVLPFKSAQAGAFVPKIPPEEGDLRESQTRESKVCE